MSKYFIFIVMLLVPGASMAGAEGPETGAAGTIRLVTGSVSYRERIALPPDAVIQVSLLDVSLMDVAAKLISEQTIKPRHSVPVPFALEYHPRGHRRAHDLRGARNHSQRPQTSLHHQS
jgi:putative lipoprotein